jgi:hypothetical protein
MCVTNAEACCAGGGWVYPGRPRGRRGMGVVGASSLPVPPWCQPRCPARRINSRWPRVTYVAIISRTRHSVLAASSVWLTGPRLGDRVAARTYKYRVKSTDWQSFNPACGGAAMRPLRSLGSGAPAALQRSRSRPLIGSGCRGIAATPPARSSSSSSGSGGEAASGGGAAAVAGPAPDANGVAGHAGPQLQQPADAATPVEPERQEWAWKVRARGRRPVYVARGFRGVQWPVGTEGFDARMRHPAAATRRPAAPGNGPRTSRAAGRQAGQRGRRGGAWRRAALRRARPRRPRPPQLVPPRVLPHHRGRPGRGARGRGRVGADVRRLRARGARADV